MLVEKSKTDQVGRGARFFLSGDVIDVYIQVDKPGVAFFDKMLSNTCRYYSTKKSKAYVLGELQKGPRLACLVNRLMARNCTGRYTKGG